MLPDAPRRFHGPGRGPLLAALGLVACCATFASAASAAVALQTTRQRSSGPVSSLVGTGLTIVPGANQVLVVAVTTAGTDVFVRTATYSGRPLTRVTLPSIPATVACRTEVWRLVNPPDGVGDLDIGLSGATTIGVGMLVFTGADQQQPTGNPAIASGSGGAPTLSTRIPDDRPLVAAACLGGTWTLTMGAPSTMAAGDPSLWDFTEGRMVGVGVQRPAFGGLATARWNVTSGGQPYTWAVLGLTITPVGGANPPPTDAGPDLAPPADATPMMPPDTGPDLAAPGLDSGGNGTPDGGATPDAAGHDDAATPPPDGAPPVPDGLVLPPASDALLPPDDTTPGELRRVDLGVGCACRSAGAPGGASVLPPLLLGVGLVLRGARRKKNRRP